MPYRVDTRSYVSRPSVRRPPQVRSRMTVHALRSTLLMRLGCVTAYRLSLDVSYGVLIPLADYYAVTKIDIDGANILESHVLDPLASPLSRRDTPRLQVLFI